MSNEITAFFKGISGVAESVYQYDYGMILVIDGLDLTSAFEVHFEHTGAVPTVTEIGEDNRVAIPNECLALPGKVTAYIYEHTGSHDGETAYVVRFQVMNRARPEYVETTPAQDSMISKAIAALSNVVNKVIVRVDNKLRYKVNNPLDEFNQISNGEPGQLLRTKGNGATEWVDEGLPTDEQTAQAVSSWLDDHPEATSTVQDGSLTLLKFKEGEFPFGTPEMFGAVGNGIVDDTEAIQLAINTCKHIVFKTNAVYKISGIHVGEDKYIEGNGSQLLGNGTGSLVTIQTYTDGQIHTSLPSVVDGFVLTNADVLVDLNKALKITLTNLTLKDFNVGIKFQGGYEVLCDGVRYEGDNNNLLAVALQIIKGGDSTFNNFMGRDVATVLDVRTTGNLFNNFHFWCFTQNVYDNSTFIKEGAISNGINRYNDFYFDCYKKLFVQNGQSYTVINNPFVLATGSIVVGESTLYTLGESSALNPTTVGQRFKINNMYFQVSDANACNISNDLTIPIHMSYLATSGAQANKIAAANIIDVERDYISGYNATSVFDFSQGVTVRSGNLFHDKRNKRITGNIVLQLSSAPYADNIVTVATPILKPTGNINSGCFASDTEWHTKSIAYLYISNSAIQIKPTENNMSFYKINFDYFYQ